MLQSDYKFGEVVTLADELCPSEEKVKVQNIFGNANGGVTLLSFKAGQELTTHTAPAEVMVTVIEGEIEFTMLGKAHSILAGQFLLMGEGVPHSVKAMTDAKVMLIKVKS